MVVKVFEQRNRLVFQGVDPFVEPLSVALTGRIVLLLIP